MSFWEGAGAGLISGAGSILSNMLTGRSVSNQMAFQERMSSTAHQREVKDLRKAGLNPMISAMGTGASSPGGASQVFENSVGAGVSSAMQARALRKDIDKVESDIAVNEAVEDATRASAMRDNTTAKQTAVQTAILEKTAPAAIKRAVVEAKQADWDMKTMNMRNVNDLINQGLGTVNSAKDAIMGLPRGKYESIPANPEFIGVGRDGTRYHKKTGEIIRSGKGR